MKPFSRPTAHTTPRFFCAAFVFTALAAPIVSAVSPRWGQAAAVLDGRLYIQGGKIDVHNAYSYSSAPNTNELIYLDFSSSFALDDAPWQSIAAPDGPSVAFHTITPYSDNQLLVFGGNPGPNTALTTRNDSVWLLSLNGNSGTWSNEPEDWANQPMRRVYHSATHYNGTVYISGGEKADDSDFGFGDLYEFDSAAETFHSLSMQSGPADLVGHAIVALSDGRLVILGGFSRSSATLVPLDTLHIFNTAEGTWSTVTTTGGFVPDPRRGFAATVLEGNTVLIHGGADGSLQNFFSDGAVLDLDTLQWTPLPALSETLGGRFGHTAVTLGSTVFFMFGFDGTSATASPLLLYDTVTNTFLGSYTAISPAPPPHTNHPPPPPEDGNDGDDNDGNDGGDNGNDHPPPPGKDDDKPDDNKPPSSPPTAAIVGSIFGVLALTAGVILFVVIVRRRRLPHRRGWSGSSDDAAEKVVMVGGLDPSRGNGGAFVARFMNIGKPAAKYQTRERFDILADEDNFDADPWSTRRRGTRQSTGDSSNYGRPGHPESHDRGQSALGSMVNASVTSLMSAFGRSGGPRLPDSPVEQSASMNPFSDSYAAIGVARPPRRQQSSGSYRDPFGDPFDDDNVVIEDEYQRAMSMQNMGIRQLKEARSAAYVPLEPINSITTDSDGSKSQTHESTDPGMTTHTTSASSHETPADSPRIDRFATGRGNIVFAVPGSPTYGHSTLYRNTSAGSRFGAGLARTVTAISSIFSGDSRIGHDRLSVGNYEGLDIKDPHPPPPRLGAIEEQSADKNNTAEVYGAGGPTHGRSLSSLRTTNSEALERLGGRWEVVQRVNTYDTAGSRSRPPSVNSPNLEEPKTYLGGGSPEPPERPTVKFVESPVEDVPATPRPKWQPLRTRKSSSSPTRPPPVEFKVERPVGSARMVLGQGLAARIQALEQSASIPIPTKSHSPPRRAASPGKEGGRKSVYTLAPKPVLFIANPGSRDASTDS